MAMIPKYGSHYSTKPWSNAKAMTRKRLLSYIFILFTFLPITARAGSFNDILTSISAISCETLYLVKQSYFPQTCIPSAYSTTAIANIVSPGIYSWAMSRLAINDEQLFPGNCKRENRADPYNPKIKFGFCSNLLLVPLRLEALGNVVLGLLVDAVTGKDPWANVAKNWYIDPAKYHSMDGYTPGSEEHEVNDEGWFTDLNLGVLTDSLNLDPSNLTNAMINKQVPVVVFPWKVMKINDTICVTTLGITGYIPVGCKYMVDPYLISQYYNFFHSTPPDLPTPNDDYQALTLQNSTNNVALSLTASSGKAGLVSCLSNSCYINTMMNTKALIPMSGPIVSCVQQMLTKALISKDICTFDQYSAITSNVTARSASTLYAFQDSMRNAVMALLTLYIMFVGIKILLGGEVPEKGDLVKYLVKFILVVYFSVGINVQGSATAVDGMSQWILPIVFDGASEIAGWITHTSPSALCVFSPSDYAPGYGYLALWDALDCRVANYLGLDQLGDFLSRNAQGAPNFDALRATIPPWVFLLFPAIKSGNLQLVMLVLSYPLLVISASAYMVYAFIVCLISITILSVLAPIFVPMALFEYTKGYFDAWVKLIISFILQPMVVSTFMLVMFTVYDFGFFGTCQFEPLKVTQAIDGTNVTRKMFALNNDMTDKSAYPNADAVKGCTNSLGWIFNAPFGIASGSVSPESAATIIGDQVGQYVDPIISQLSSVSPTDAAGAAVAVGTVIPPDQTFDNQAQQYPILSAVQTKQSLFFPITTLVGNLRDFMFSLFTACFCLYLLKELSQQIAEFAADMTEGIVIPGAKPPPPIPPMESGGGSGGGAQASDTASKGTVPRASDTASKGTVPRASDAASKGSAAKAGDHVTPHSSSEARASDHVTPHGDGDSTKKNTAASTIQKAFRAYQTRLSEAKTSTASEDSTPPSTTTKQTANSFVSNLISKGVEKVVTKESANSVMQNVTKAIGTKREISNAAANLISGATNKGITNVSEAKKTSGTVMGNVTKAIASNRTKATITNEASAVAKNAITEGLKGLTKPENGGDKS